MIESQLVDIVKNIMKSIPNANELSQNAEKKVYSILSNSLQKLDIVSKEEFEIQTQVLLKTRKKLEALENKIETIEKAMKESAYEIQEP